MDQIQKIEREKLLRRKLDLLLKTGQMLVESAADTNRIIRNMNRVAVSSVFQRSIFMFTFSSTCLW